MYFITMFAVVLVHVSLATLLILMIWNEDKLIKWEQEHIFKRFRKPEQKKHFASTEYKKILREVENQKMIDTLKKF